MTSARAKGTHDQRAAGGPRSAAMGARKKYGERGNTGQRFIKTKPEERETVFGHIANDAEGPDGPAQTQKILAKHYLLAQSMTTLDLPPKTQIFKHLHAQRTPATDGFVGRTGDQRERARTKKLPRARVRNLPDRQRAGPDCGERTDRHALANGLEQLRGIKHEMVQLLALQVIECS